MKWTVAYEPSAKDELARRWLNSSNRQALANAANYVDRILRTDPMAAGESREGGRRVLIAPPLAVYFDVHPDDCLVIVWHVIESK